MKKFNTLVDLFVDELSGVDRPAQEPALFHLAKRHPLVELPSTSSPTPVKKDQETTMTDAEKQALADAQATKEALAKAKADLDAVTKERDAAVQTAEAILELTDDHRGFAKRLSGAARAAFIAKNSTERAAQVEAARGKEVYKRSDGKIFYESDNQEVVELWKRDDAREARIIKAEAAQAEAVLKGRVAKVLGNVGGKDPGKIAVLKAVALLPEEERKLAEETLEKANAQCARSFERHSSSGGPDTLDEDDGDSKVEKKVDEIAKKLQAKDPNLDWTVATQKAWESREVIDLLDAQGNR